MTLWVVLTVLPETETSKLWDSPICQQKKSANRNLNLIQNSSADDINIYFGGDSNNTSKNTDLSIIHRVGSTDTNLLKLKIKLLNGNLIENLNTSFLVRENEYLIYNLSLIYQSLKLKSNQIKILTIYLIILSISLEVLHLIIPERTFQWSDLFGNLLGVIVVILIKNLINKLKTILDF